MVSHLTGLRLILSTYADRLEDGQRIEPSQLRKLEEMVRDGAQQIRRLSHGLHPVRIKRDGLSEVLRDLAELLGGHFTTADRENGGTRLLVRIPRE